MKQRITLLSFIFFLTLISFGQKKENKTSRFGERFRIENQTKNLNLFENVFIINALFNKCKGLNLNSKFNSHQTNSSPMIIKYGLDSELSQSWDETISQWFNSGKVEFTYNTNGYPTQEIYYGWDGFQWFYDAKFEYTYDNNGIQIQTILFEWLGWGVFFKYEITYDTNGNPTLVTSYDWDGNQWYLVSKIESTYDTNGDQIQYIVYDWKEATSQWSYFRKTEYTYDNNRNQTQYIEYSWDGSSWWYDWKTEYTYDNNGNLTQYIDYSWVGDQWVNEWKTNFTYNDLYSYSDLILPYYSTIPGLFRPFNSKIFFNHMLTNGIGYIWDSDLNDWAITESYAFSYSEKDILSTSEIIEQKLKIYPNPVSNVLTIKSEINPIDKVEIYSVLGKKIKTIDSDFENINTEDLSKGIYLLRINSEKGTTIKKLIKK